MEKILIVDDNEIIRFTLSELFEESGFESKAVEDGSIALDEIRNNSYGAGDSGYAASRNERT